jgi:undecaprenyl diphosphate synthase
MRIPKHIGIIPDGNRRYATANGMEKWEGYEKGLLPGLAAFNTLRELGVREVTFYGFTIDNTKRPTAQRLAFTRACVDAVKLIADNDCELLVMGNTDSDMFPKELLPYTTRTKIGNGGVRLNFLVNYCPFWDLSTGTPHSNDISRIDLIIRWGGMRRLSGFLPMQSVYSDFYVVNDLWPDFKKQHITEALNWYNTQDITLGG